jgi:hypothetical protein
MKKLLLLCCLLFLLFSSLFATHNKGGEITYECLNYATHTYRVTITTYTFYCPACNPVPPDRDVLDSVHWGDGSQETFYRISHSDSLGDSIRVNRFVATHSYVGYGNYKIYFSDPNRNAGISNIPNSVNIPFCVESYLRIHPAFHCPNNSIQFADVPIFEGQVGRPFKHSVTVVDPDHDSLSFEFAIPLATSNTPVPGYTIPPASSVFSINPISGQILWDSPTAQGDYCIAVKINEWRIGSLIGYVIRDFQVSMTALAADTLNAFAPLSLSQDASGNYFTSVNAGDTVDVHAVYYGNPLMSHTGEAFSLFNPPVVQYSSSLGMAIADLAWITDSANARSHPYIFTFRGSHSQSLITLKTDLTFLVYVIGVNSDTSCSYIGINELEGDKNQIMVFPNPATNELRIQGADLPAGQAGLRIEKIELYDLIGEKIFQSNISNPMSQISVDVRQLPSGIYFVRVKTDKGISAAKFVKE